MTQGNFWTPTNCAASFLYYFFVANKTKSNEQSERERERTPCDGILWMVCEMAFGAASEFSSWIEVNFWEISESFGMIFWCNTL